MTLDELVGSFRGKTTIQKQEHLNWMLNQRVSFNGEIGDVSSTHIHLHTGPPLTAGYHPYTLVRYDDDRFRKTVLGHSQGDIVRIEASLVSADVYSDRFEFKLVAITLISTPETRKREADAEARRSAEEARRAAEEAETARRNKQTRELAFKGAMLGPLYGGILVGVAGCCSCVANAPRLNTWITPFNLLNGSFYGAMAGLIIGPLIGLAIGELRR